MKIIRENKEKTIIINKSKFIGIVRKVDTKDDINTMINEIKTKYKDATHICYAYLFDNEKKYSDDKEPTGTAGKPILDVLEKNNLNYILAIVIRYFGGIKLGANGLVRAYSNSISEIIKDNIKEIEYASLIRIEETYEKSNNIDYLLRDSIIIKKEYTDKLIIEAIVKKKDINNLSNLNYTVIKDLIV